MDQSDIVRYVAETFPGVDILQPTDGPGAGDTFFIYDPERNLEGTQQFPFATIVTKDYGDFDNASKLDRPGAYRLNIGVSRATFGSTLRDAPADPDFASFDQLLPHPTYASQSWLCIVNPSQETFNTVIQSLLSEAYGMAAKRLSSRRPETSS